LKKEEALLIDQFGSITSPRTRVQIGLPRADGLSGACMVSIYTCNLYDLLFIIISQQTKENKINKRLLIITWL
jgi:hypothetical protein